MRYEVELDEMTLDLITRAVDMLENIPPEERTVESDIRRMAVLGSSCVLDARVYRPSTPLSSMSPVSPPPLRTSDRYSPELLERAKALKSRDKQRTYPMHIWDDARTQA